VSADLAGPKVRVAALERSGGESLAKARLRIGDVVHLMRGVAPDPARHPGEAHQSPKRPVRIWCTAPPAIDALAPGQRVWFDDGAIGGVVEAIAPDRAAVRITVAPPDGGRIRADKGIHFPDAAFAMPALTEEDLDNLAVLVDEVDAIALSFAHGPEDLGRVQDAIAARTDRRPTIVLKLETRAAFDRLPEMLFALMRWESAAIMIARGDLAVECGYERLSEVQEEIIWLAEASHTPAIWATQVLETLAHTGVPTRAEITDAAMGQRAECVMLNKGPYIVQAITFLDDILRRMASHQRKKTPLLRPLHIAAGRSNSDAATHPHDRR
jgi:pyruvate kinase